MFIEKFLVIEQSRMIMLAQQQEENYNLQEKHCLREKNGQ